MAGGVLSAFFGGLKWPALTLRSLFIISIAFCSAVGGLDEYHQSFTPGRSGNDLGDWLADTLGGTAGALLIIKFILPHLLDKIGNSSKAFAK